METRSVPRVPALPEGSEGLSRTRQNTSAHSCQDVHRTLWPMPGGVVGRRMSKKQSNRKRAASLCSRATGMTYSRCLESAMNGHITPLRPVPDANSPEQRRFEARIAHTLAYTLRDRQLDSAVLGVQGVRLQGEQLTLRLHPIMARRIVADLLPVFDVAYGGLRGVPGLRIRYRAGEWSLVDVRSSARVHLEGFDLRPGPKLPAVERGLTPVWRDVLIGSPVSSATRLSPGKRAASVGGPLMPVTCCSAGFFGARCW